MTSVLDALRTESFHEIGAILVRDAELIVEDWAARSRNERPETASTHREELEDRLGHLLHTLGKSLCSPNGEFARGHALMALEHGEQRWKLGWRLGEVVDDYQLLRVVVLEHLYAGLGRAYTLDELLAVNLVLDDAVAASVVAYVEHQELRLKEAHQRLTDFLSVLGHELRTPLHAMSLGLQILQTPDPEGREEVQATIEQEMQLMSRLLEDMLDATRITRGQLSLERRPVALNAVLQRAVEGARSLITERRHTLHLELLDEDVRLNADPHRLQQVFVNLLLNAAKYTDPGGEITFSAEVDEANFACIRVQDNGQGIDEDVLPQIFDLFVQSPENVGRGLGIGLALTRALIDLHGGRIEAHSEGPGRGSEFIVRLPVMSGDAGERSSQDHDAHEALPAAPPRRVLIVDDADISAKMLATLLGRCGHTTFVACDGEEALALAGQQHPEVVLLDLGLPGIDGYEVARRLREKPEYDNALVIAMTGYADQPERERTARSGFDHHLVKPVELHTVQALIAEHFGPGY